MIYLDNAATTMIDPEVLDAMMPYLTYEYGNPGTLYELGFSAKKAVEKAREQVAKFMGAKSPEQIIFTSGGTESNNMVFNSFRVLEEERCGGRQNNKKRGIIVSSIEHDSVLRSADMLIKSGFDVQKIAPHVDGEVHKEDLEQMLRESNEPIGLVSAMYMNNEIGSINDIKKLSRICHEAGALFHSDCVQAAGCIEINAEESGCDFMSISSHKIHGPKGVGALYVRDTDMVSPMIVGGASQERGLRGGTENVPGIVGLGSACSLYNPLRNIFGWEEIRCKREFWNELYTNMLGRGLENCVRDNAMSSIKRGKTLSVTFRGVDAEALVVLLGTKGIYVSAGSACTSNEQTPSHVLTGIGMTEEDARSTVRFSFSRTNTMDESREAARIVADSVDELLNGGN